MKTDPTDTGGLFTGRRPGTRPVKYRESPKYRGAARQRVDRMLAAGLLGLMVFINLLFWGPLPVAWLWVGSQVDYLTGSVSLGIAAAFAGMIATLMVTLALCAWLDRAWRILRRAAGHEQREGMLVRIFAVTAVVAGLAFLVWFVVLEGPAPTLAPQ
jgi:hypothetical protein